MADWGIYPADGGAPMVIDSIKSIEPDREAKSLAYPIETGDFRSYNKVQVPGEGRVIVTKGGSVDERSAFLVALKAALTSTDLFNVVVPEGAYMGYTLTKYTMKRASDSGITLLTVEMTFTEVRQTAASTTTNSKEPSGTVTTSNGPTLPADFLDGVLPSVAADPASLVGQVPALPSGASLAQISSTVGKLVKAGATIGNMVAKGVKFSNIPIIAKAAQSVAVQLGVQPTQIKIAQKARGLFVNVAVSNNPLASGVIGRDGAALVRNASPAAFQGDLMFWDSTGKGADPTLAGLGTRFLLLHAGAS